MGLWRELGRKVDEKSVAVGIGVGYQEDPRWAKKSPELYCIFLFTKPKRFILIMLLLISSKSPFHEIRNCKKESFFVI